MAMVLLLYGVELSADPTKQQNHKVFGWLAPITLAALGRLHQTFQHAF
jgi:hypothetical protein